MKKILLVILFIIAACDKTYYCFDRCIDQANTLKLMCKTDECKQEIDLKLVNCIEMCKI